MNHLVSYSDATHQYYFLTRFVEGLRADICAVIMVQRPMDLDTACALALLQEEVADGDSYSPPRVSEQRYVKLPPRSVSQTANSASATPVTRAADNRGLNVARHARDDRLIALRNYRRAKGMCFKCGERWG